MRTVCILGLFEKRFVNWNFHTFSIMLERAQQNPSCFLRHLVQTRYHILLILTPGYKWVTIRRFCLTYSRHTLPVASFSFASSLDCITQDVSLPFHAVSCAIYHTSSQLEKEVRKCMMLSNSFDKSKPVPLADRLHSTEKFHD